MASAIQTSGHDPILGYRRQLSLTAARRRTRFVALLRIAALAVFGALTLNALVQLILNAVESDGTPLAAPEIGTERIVNPRFTGRDSLGAPFIVTAAAAVRQVGDIAGLTALERPQLDYGLLGASADPSAVLAQSGVYNPRDRILTLNETVRFETRSGYAFESSIAVIQLGEGVIIGNAPVYGEAPWGAIHADGFEVRERGNHVIFRGNVRTRLYAEDANPAPAQETP